MQAKYNKDVPVVWQISRIQVEQKHLRLQLYQIQ